MGKDASVTKVAPSRSGKVSAGFPRAVEIVGNHFVGGSFTGAEKSPGLVFQNIHSGRRNRTFLQEADLTSNNKMPGMRLCCGFKEVFERIAVGLCKGTGP